MRLFSKVVNAEFSLIMGVAVFFAFLFLAWGCVLWMNNSFMWHAESCCSWGVVSPWYEILSFFVLFFVVCAFVGGGYTVLEIWKWRNKKHCNFS